MAHSSIDGQSFFVGKMFRANGWLQLVQLPSEEDGIAESILLEREARRLVKLLTHSFVLKMWLTKILNISIVNTRHR